MLGFAPWLRLGSRARRLYEHKALFSVRKFKFLPGAAAIMLTCGPPAADAHRDDYLDETLVYLTLEHAEFEAEYWLDYGSLSETSEHFFRHNLALERGISDHWMIDGRMTVKTPDVGSTRLDSARVESRFRFKEEGEWPIDVAISGELNWEHEEDGSTTLGLEPRLILSRDFNEKLNLTLNLSEEIPLDAENPAFLVALGTRFNWTQFARIGSELKYDFDKHAGSAIPQVWFAFPHDIIIKTGYSMGFDRNEEDFARIAVEVEF